MSVDRERLRRLRVQAGAPDAPAVVPAALPVLPCGPGPVSVPGRPDVGRPGDIAIVEVRAGHAAGEPEETPAPARPAVDAQRLRLLRRQSGGLPAPAPPAAVAAPSPPSPPGSASEPVFAWIDREPRPSPPPAAAALVRRNGDEVQQRGVLRRLLGLRERALPDAAPRIRGQARDRRLPGEEIAPGLHLVEAFLPQPLPATALSLAFARRDSAVPPQHWLFFDTETTGLAGGTGTRAFMIGAADWRRDPQRGEGLRVRQLVMSTLAAETTMLEVFASWLAPDTVLSSYNGRCYDAPLLKTRYRLARRPEPLSALDHVDLLFPTRRRYRGSWENCRLATIERQLLRIVREDDLPGAQAPAAWLHYLRGGDAVDLRRVLAHNHQDVVTLAQLLLRLVAAEEAERLMP